VIHLANDEIELLRELDEALWRDETRFNRQRRDELIAEDFCEFSRSGRVYRREDTPGMRRQPIDAVLPPQTSGRDCSDETSVKSAITAREPRWSLVC
jgi:hypothetical protein